MAHSCQPASLTSVQPPRTQTERDRKAARRAPPSYERGFSFLFLKSANSDTPDTLTTCVFFGFGVVVFYLDD